VLQPERFEQRNLSLNSQARVAEYELIMRAQFSVLNADNKEEIPPTTVLVVKRMQNDPDNVTGKASELQLLKVESRRELAQQILQRTSFYAAASQANNP
jgi:LPS-assembly lipoprotein